MAIIAFFAVLALPSFMSILAKAKRTEAYIHLRALHMLEKAYFAEHGTYTSALQGANSLNWKPEGSLNYKYGTGSGDSASAQGFIISAVADIDGDGDMDILTINETGEIKLVKDDLA